MATYKFVKETNGFSFQIDNGKKRSWNNNVVATVVEGEDNDGNLNDVIEFEVASPNFKRTIDLTTDTVTIGGVNVSANGAQAICNQLRDSVFPKAAPVTALPTEYPATYAAMQASITSDPTTKRDFFVTADETNGGAKTRYSYDGARLKIQNNIQVNVKDYGAKGDGSTDDTSAFSQAITAVSNMGGGSIVVPNGVYNAGINNTHSNITFVLQGAVKFLQTVHFAVGSGPDIVNTDVNYNASTTTYVENVHIQGVIEFGNGGRLGCFYARNCSVDEVRCSGNHNGIHIYSHSENISIGEVYSIGGRQDSSNTGAVFIDQYSSVTASKPKNIHIGKLYIETPYWHGLYIDCNGFSCNEVIVRNSGLSGVRITNGSSGIFIGKVDVDSSGISYDTVNNFLRTGVTIDAGATDVQISKVYATNNYYTNLFIKDSTTTDINIGSAVCGNSVSTSYSPLYILNAVRVKIGVAKTYNATVYGYGTEVDGVTDLKIDKLHTYNNTASGLIIKGTSDKVNINHILAHGNLNAIRMGGSGSYSFGRINSYNNTQDHFYLTGLTGSLHIKSFIADGTGISAFYSAFSIQNNSGGNLYVGYAHFKNFSATSAKGIFGYNATGSYIFESLHFNTCAVGYDISGGTNTGWVFGQVTYTSVTTKRAAQPADTINNGFAGAGTAAPTTGTYFAGDKWQNSAPSASGYLGWVCVTGGTPGTWKGYGQIQA